MSSILAPDRVVEDLAHLSNKALEGGIYVRLILPILALYQFSTIGEGAGIGTGGTTAERGVMLTGWSEEAGSLGQVAKEHVSCGQRELSVTCWKHYSCHPSIAPWLEREWNSCQASLFCEDLEQVNLNTDCWVKHQR